MAGVVAGEDAERDLPSRLRRTLSIESGANDGLALPLVAVALTGVGAGQAVAGVAGRLAWEVLAGVVIGAACGIGAGRAFHRAHAGDDLAEGPRLVFTLLLSVAVLGLARLARTDGVLAVFVAGLAYNRWIDQEVRGAQDAVDEAVNRYLVLCAEHQAREREGLIEDDDRHSGAPRRTPDGLRGTVGALARGVVGLAASS